MNPYLITTDSACDLPADYLKKHRIYTQSLFYKLGEEVYGGKRELDPHEFYTMMRGGQMPTTMAINPEELTEGLTPILKEGYDIIHLAFSSGLSSSCQNAVIAAEDLKEIFPERKITVIDTKCASLGQGLLVHKAVQAMESGCSYEETIQRVQDLLPHMCHVFTVDDLFHLYRGGRVSKTVAVLGTIVNVKPVMHVDDEGHLIPVSKVRGRKKSLTALVDMMEEKIKGYEQENDTVFISHGDCIDDANFVADQVRKRFGIQDILINYVSPTIGAHSDPGTLALFFIGSKR